MSDANADKTASSDNTGKPASSPDELIKDLDLTLSKEEQNQVRGGAAKHGQLEGESPSDTKHLV